jgi:N-formylglutamate deformylase
LYPNDARTTPADFVIGNQMDQTSSAKLRKLLTVFLKEAGYSVSNNHSFRGGFITRHFSEPGVVLASFGYSAKLCRSIK